MTNDHGGAILGSILDRLESIWGRFGVDLVDPGGERFENEKVSLAAATATFLQKSEFRCSVLADSDFRGGL